MSDSTEVKLCNLIEFSKIIKDLLNDILLTFNDKTESIINNNVDFKEILTHDFEKSNIDLTYDDKFIESVKNLFIYCKKILPLHFFDILYQNEELFTNNTELFLLPNINFSDLYPTAVS